jgi:acyl carrier protein
MAVLTVWILGRLVALSIVGVVLHDRINLQRARRLLGGRPPRDSSSFGRAYFGESGHRALLATEVREILAQHVPFLLDGLAPDDAFVRDLRMDELDSMATVEFVLAVEERFGIKIPDADAQGILTFRQLIDYLEHRVPAEWVRHREARAGEQ